METKNLAFKLQYPFYSYSLNVLFSVCQMRVFLDRFWSNTSIILLHFIDLFYKVLIFVIKKPKILIRPLNYNESKF